MRNRRIRLSGTSLRCREVYTRVVYLSGCTGRHVHHGGCTSGCVGGHIHHGGVYLRVCRVYTQGVPQGVPQGGISPGLYPGCTSGWYTSWFIQGERDPPRGSPEAPLTRFTVGRHSQHRREEGCTQVGERGIPRVGRRGMYPCICLPTVQLVGSL